MPLPNCWEYTNCGREKNCPAHPDHGRGCFAVTGTWCRGEQQPSYAHKIARCRGTCSFYKEIMGIAAWEELEKAVNE
ncbi:MAG: two-CW domain-containing protein [Thermodesulfobacteriota bacterium]